MKRKRAVKMSRDRYMDFLRGVAVLAVIIGHSVAMIENLNVLCNLVYSFHMPLLMFVSAYIEEKYREKYEGRINNALIKRAGSLLLPYVIWTCIYHVMSIGQFQVYVKEVLFDLLGFTDSGLWFLPVLFGLKCMHFIYWYLQSKIGTQKLFSDILLCFVIGIMILLLAVITKHTFISNMLSYAIPYFAGVFIAGKREIKKLIDKPWVVITAIVVYLGVFPFFSIYNVHWMTQIQKMLLALCFIIVCCKVHNKWRGDNAAQKLLCLVGEYSLEIYLLHGYFLKYRELIASTDSAFVGALGAFVFSIGIALISIAVAKVLSISTVCKKILFGR